MDLALNLTMDVDRRARNRLLLWCLPVAVVLVYVVAVRESGETPPVPFLLLYAGVVTASFGGTASGALGGLLVSGFVVNSAVIGFGPSSLTGSYPRAAVGCAIYLLTGVLLGRNFDENRRLVGAMNATRDDLEVTVLRRTEELQRSKAVLEQQIAERDEMQRTIDAHDARMRHSQRLESVGLLAGGIAHDFNNLLTSILGNASMLRELSNDDQDATFVVEIEKASLRAAELCEQMLSYAGESQGAVTTFALVDVFEEMIGFVTASVPKKVSFELECRDAIDVHGDRSQIGQVVLNLLTNAADSIEDVGTVRSRVRVVDITAAELSEYLLGDDLPPGRYVSMEVEDEGSGMTGDRIEKVFDPFFSTKVSGRGLGLAVVFGAARAHRGAIRLWSEVGVGTAVTVVVPYSAQTVRQSEVQRGGARGSGVAYGNGERGTVLVADDDAAIRHIVSRVLEGDGWRVLLAENGAQAVEYCRQHPDLALALLDLTMPHMDGREARGEIASIDPGLPVVMMSGYAKEISRVAPVADFVRKPFTSQELRAVVNQVARQLG